MTKYIVIAGLVALALLFGILSVFKPTTEPPLAGGASGQPHYQFESFLQGLGGGQRDQFQVSNKGVITNNGVDTLSVQYTYVATTGVPVAIPNPFGTVGLAPDAANSTTTVLDAVCVTTGGTPGATATFDLSTSSSAYGSSTPVMMRRSIASASQDFAAWSGSTASTSNAQVGLEARDGSYPYVLGPTGFLTWRNATGTPGTLSTPWTGTCSATFVKP